MFRLKVGVHPFVLLSSMLTILSPQALYDLALHWLWSSYINVSWQNTECGGRLQTDWRITCVPYIFPRHRPAHIPAHTPAPPKILSIHPTPSLCTLLFHAPWSLLHLRVCRRTDIPLWSYVGYDIQTEHRNLVNHLLSAALVTCRGAGHVFDSSTSSLSVISVPSESPQQQMGEPSVRTLLQSPLRYFFLHLNMTDGRRWRHVIKYILHRVSPCHFHFSL